MDCEGKGDGWVGWEMRNLVRDSNYFYKLWISLINFSSSKPGNRTLLYLMIFGMNNQIKMWLWNPCLVCTVCTTNHTAAVITVCSPNMPSLWHHCSYKISDFKLSTSLFFPKNGENMLSYFILFYHFIYSCLFQNRTNYTKKKTITLREGFKNWINYFRGIFR